MAESPMFCARVPGEQQEKIRDIAEASGRKEAEVEGQRSRLISKRLIRLR
ncbi:MULTISPECIES: hypothetical protein [Cyanophyceae]|nr:hypothetical protein [Trichocoleus sp. FACHB-40]MBD2001729.1 hypothetical protein [Trichocoleus sp. FACHB-40]